MSLCDTQLLTGISMLLSGFSSLNDFDYMSLTSWLMVANLAWFSNLTHQCGLVFLRGYLYRNPNERMWRLFLMTVLFIGLASAMTPTIGAVVFDAYYGTQPSTPAVVSYAILLCIPLRLQELTTSCAVFLQPRGRSSSLC